MLRCVRIAELGKGNPELGGPPRRVDVRGDLPDSVPGGITVAVVVERVVALHPVGVHRKFVSSATVVIGIHDHRDFIRRAAHIPASERVQDAVRVRVRGAYEDVEVVGVVSDPELRGV